MLSIASWDCCDSSIFFWVLGGSDHCHIHSYLFDIVHILALRNEFLIELMYVNPETFQSRPCLTSMEEVSNGLSQVCGYFDMSHGVGTLIL